MAVVVKDHSLPIFEYLSLLMAVGALRQGQTLVVEELIPVGKKKKRERTELGWTWKLPELRPGSRWTEHLHRRLNRYRSLLAMPSPT